ncbi:MAG: quinoprotein relay system zinc metallohydrolase 1 [Cycloclasticus sp.]|nr:quinoprotein relay system zinc metallohydrolase 1 [Cycloclasticus sp.]
MNKTHFSILCLFLMMLTTTCSLATNFDYQLKPIKVAQDTYVLEGKTEDFSFENGGNIVNTGFIVTPEGVVVIDTGPSLRYGQQMKKAIESITDKPINRVYLTHHHPDHFLGNQAFKGTPIYALDTTLTSIKNEGAGFADNLYIMVGDWMRGTEATKDGEVVKPGRITIGDHQLDILSYSGHTSSDMVILDQTTGVIFAGDIVFNKRTLTTPHADIKKWLSTITELNKLSFKVLVPGHGPISLDKKVFSEMTAYLAWLENTIKGAVNNGLTMNEAMQLPIPKRFSSNAQLQQEYSRSVVHLYPFYENRFFKRIN